MRVEIAVHDRVFAVFIGGLHAADREVRGAAILSRIIKRLGRMGNQQIALFKEVVAAVRERLDLERIFRMVATFAQGLIQAETVLIPVRMRTAANTPIALDMASTQTKSLEKDWTSI